MKSKRVKKPAAAVKSASLDLFTYRDAVAFLRAYIAQKNSHGFKTSLARAMGCQVAYLSQILSLNASLSSEQAMGFCEETGFSVQEQKYFLLINHRTKAATMALREFYEHQIAEILEERRNLKKRLKNFKSLSEESASTYYSRWHYAAIHMALFVPEFQDLSHLSQTLGLSLKTLRQCIGFLASIGLVKKVSEGRYASVDLSLHLAKDSPLILRHHANWRLKALQALDEKHSHDLHYSVVVSLSQKQLPKIQERFIRALEEIWTDVQDSDVEDALWAYTLDFFPVSKT